MTDKKINCFECEGVDCESLSSINVCKNAQKCYTMTLFESDGIRGGIRGCIFDRQHVPYYCYSQTASRHKVKRGGYYYVECCDEEMCNSRMFKYPNVEINNHTDVSAITMEDFETQLKNIVELTAAMVVFMILLKYLYEYVFLRCIKRKAMSGSSGSMTYFDTVDEIDIGSESYGEISIGSLSSTCIINVEDETEFLEKDKIDEHTNPINGLASTLTLNNALVDPKNPTLAHQIKMIKCLYNGNFGFTVWRGIYNEEEVAVKVFTSNRLDLLFYRETEVYVKILTNRHEHVVNYIGSDTIRSSIDNSVQHYLVLQYYPYGSLYNFLIGLSKPLDYKQMFDLCLSLCKGLLYLHTEIRGSHGKINLAHRNLTSKNVMVKANGVCAIGEFGYAVTQEMLDKSFIDLDEASKRYMSPEILTKTINVKNLADFFCSDVYSMGLIFWEICRCHSKIGFSLDYAAPYSEWLEPGQKPNLRIMHQLVVEEQLRPTIPLSWQHDPKLNHIGVMLRECWYPRPKSRLTALRIKKTLVRVAKEKPKVKVSVL